jgi:putative transposase
MDVKKRTFSKEEKIRLVQEASEHGVKVTLDKYGIYPATYYSWKKKYTQMGEAGLQHGMTVAHLKEIRRLEKENEVLKKMIAEKELENHLHMEMLKKKYPEVYKKN